MAEGPFAHRKFYRYTITVDILSDDSKYDPQELHEVATDIENDAVDGRWDITGKQEIDAKEMVALLLERGSDPEIFHLDEDGNELGEEPISASQPTVQGPRAPEQRELS